MNSSPLRWAGGTPLDPGVLQSLRRDVGDEVVRRFIRTYVRLLPERLDAVPDALARHEPHRAVRIAGDLCGASSMLGAVRLARMAFVLERRLSHGELDRAAGDLP